MNIELPTTIRRAEPGDWRKLADITAEAFANDPVSRWIFGTPKAIRSCFRVFAREIYTRHGICHLAGDHGATMWARSDASDNLSTLGQLAFAAGLSFHGNSGAVKRAIHAGEIMAENHPRKPHLYLFTIGVTSSARGTGQGHALLAPVLAECDRIGLPCYLENSNPDNFGFYSAQGFEHMHHFDVGPGGPPLQAMWREAK